MDVGKRAKIMTIGIILTAAVSILFLLLMSAPVFPGADNSSKELAADIYQDGKLLRSLTLEKDTESYMITITAPDGGSNIIEVRSGEIGIISADCPDKLCVKQGFRHNSLLPIICLPHRLVIQIHETDSEYTSPSYSADAPSSDGQEEKNTLDAIVQ